MKKFIIHWVKGTTEEIAGTDIANAFMLAGYAEEDLRAMYYWEESKEDSYDPTKHGAVVAIRIFIDEYKYGCTPMAELAFAFGGTEIIPWDEPAKREKFSSGINGYTCIYDERPKRKFADWITRR